MRLGQSPPLGRNPYRNRLLALTLAPLVLGSVSCGRKQPAPPQRLVVAWDTSESNRRGLPTQVEAGVRAIRSLSPERDQLTFYRVDADTQELFDNSPLPSREELQALVVRELRSPARQTGTRPGRFWATVADRAATFHSRTTILFFTDGENDHATTGEQAKLRTAIHQLARNPWVARVGIYGVKPELRATLRREWMPLGERLDLRGPQELQGDLRLARGR